VTYRRCAVMPPVMPPNSGNSASKLKSLKLLQRRDAKTGKFAYLVGLTPYRHMLDKHVVIFVPLYCSSPRDYSARTQCVSTVMRKSNLGADLLEGSQI
jgi:hypothetical protein